jgi:uncharacterized membrane protein SirB2
MKLNRFVRASHRWVSLAFTLIVGGIFLTLGLGQEPAQWVYYLPLLPLALLLISGLYLFALPYFSKARTAAPAK